MSGSMRFCCATMENLVDKNGNRLHINNDSLEKAWNVDQVKETRLKMIRGETVSACKKCVEQETRGYQSMRESDKVEENFSITDENGHVNKFPDSMELHFGNLCNLRCKMCGQQYSNQIGKELLEIGDKEPGFLEWITKESGNVNIWTNNLTVEYRWFQNQKIKEKLFPYIAQHIKKMVVIGGEPTVIPEFWELFKYLDDHDKLKDMTITVTTNLTNTNPKLINWLPKLKEWNIWASVDGIGDRTEYIRYPSSFDKVVENLNFYKSMLGSNGSIILSPAIQLLNIDQLDEILRWWICNYDILPTDYKLSVAEKLEGSVDYFSKYRSIKNFYITQIENLRKEVYTEEQKKHFQKAFVRYNDTQDRHRRGKTWRQLLPDLEKALTKLTL
jgi:hypothetical protein